MRAGDTTNPTDTTPITTPLVIHFVSEIKYTCSFAYVFVLGCAPQMRSTNNAATDYNTCPVLLVPLLSQLGALLAIRLQLWLRRSCRWLYHDYDGYDYNHQGSAEVSMHRETCHRPRPRIRHLLTSALHKHAPQRCNVDGAAQANWIYSIVVE